MDQPHIEIDPELAAQGLTSEQVWTEGKVEISQEEYSSIENWVFNTAGGFSTTGFGGVDAWGSYGMGSAYNQDLQQRADFFTRNEYRAPRNIMDEMRLAYELMNRDDIVSGVADLTEGMAISKHKWECEDLDEEDVWHQISRDLDLDFRLREMWRELFGMSQFYVAMFWGKKTYTVSGTTDKKNKRRKSYALNVPLSLSILDPTRVVPVGNIMFNRERLAWIADPAEMEQYDKQEDQVLNQLFEGRYSPSTAEESILDRMGIDSDYLMLLRKDAVWRHTVTRPGYKRWADIRLKSVFPLMDLKQNLRMMERAHLIGATNFIVLVKKGTDKIPARQQELNNLDQQVRKLSRVPMLVGDHRLSVEIVTPAMDVSLNKEKWDVIDQRIANRLLQSMSQGDSQNRSDNQQTVARAIARGLETRRHGLSRAIETNLVEAVMDRNKSVLKSRPSHVWTPKHLALDWDANFAMLLMKTRDRGDLSRQTFLEEMDFDQEIEAKRREYEEEHYDDLFLTAVPFDSPQNQSAPGSAAKPAAKKAPAKSTGGADNKTGKAPTGRPTGSKTGTSKGA